MFVSKCEAEHDPQHKGGSGKKSKKSGLGSMFEKRSTPKMSKLKVRCSQLLFICTVPVNQCQAELQHSRRLK